MLLNSQMLFYPTNNVEMPATVGTLTLMSRINFMVSLVEHVTSLFKLNAFFYYMAAGFNWTLTQLSSYMFFVSTSIQHGI